MAWWMYATAAALIWGIHYNLLHKAMGTISPITAYWMPTIIMVLGLPWLGKQLVADFKATLAADPMTQFAVSVIMFTSFAASYSLYKAIQMHNPVHAGLLEITYPIFIAVFALIIFQENHFNWGTIVGGFLIILGAGTIIYTAGGESV